MKNFLAPLFWLISISVMFAQVNTVPIGMNPNGYLLHTSTSMWYEPDLNSVVNIHKANVSNSQLAVDISLDGGFNWQNDVVIYDGGTFIPPTGVQVTIINPEGNTDPANAWISYFGVTHNGNDYDYLYGTANLLDPSQNTSNTTPPGFDSDVMRMAFTRTTNGTVWLAYPKTDVDSGYQDEFVMLKGEFDLVSHEMNYEEFLIEAPCEDAWYPQIAFEPQGQTGYLYWNNTDGSIPGIPVHPLLLKTEDGGNTWSEELISVSLGGPDGIEAVKNYLTDEQIIEIFGELIDRDEINYVTSWTGSDISVDAFGNPHLVTTVYVLREDGSYSAIPETMAVFDLYTINGDDENWYGIHLGSLKTFEGLIVQYSMYNRVQTASDKSGLKLFYSWNDTRLEGVDDNVNPDIYARGFNLQNNKITEGNSLAGSSNVTQNSVAMWESYFHTMSPYVISNSNEYTLPLNYLQLQDFDPTNPAQYMYIQDFTFTANDFNIDVPNPAFPVGIKEDTFEPGMELQPNPASEMSRLYFNLQQSSDVNISIVNIKGQQLKKIYKGNLNSGNHSIELDLSDLPAGMYVCNISTSGGTANRKLVVY